MLAALAAITGFRIFNPNRRRVLFTALRLVSYGEGQRFAARNSSYIKVRYVTGIRDITDNRNFNNVVVYKRITFHDVAMNIRNPYSNFIGGHKRRREKEHIQQYKRTYTMHFTTS